ncbi:MAG TPA: EpsI family protein [Gemmatimonadales bacterium]|nr:EpsI family protein [Gemmatimonadales bacterium]
MSWRPWLPAIILGLGALGTLALRPDRPLPLRLPLDQAVGDTIAAYAGTPLVLSPAELAVAGPDAYLFRSYRTPADTAGTQAFTVYVGYYQRQIQGKTIHSPKNCLPGAGWEPLASGTDTVGTREGPVAVNRYLLQLHQEKALVLYWYQGRGRVASNEYLVKWQLLRDSGLKHRSDEALVRVMVPLSGDDEAGALRLASSVAARIIPELYRALPE